MVKADDILLFVQVVDNGSFSKVAELLELTNSVVSKRVARLEANLNVQLLYRTTRKLSLTDAGRLLYSKGKLAKTAMQDATNVVNGYSDQVKGNIKITMPLVSSQVLLSKSVAEFCHQYSDVSIDLHVNNRFVDLIEEGYDLAIRTAYLEDSSLVARRLVDSKWVVCASPEYLQRRGTPMHPNDLHEHDCLLYKHESAGTDNWQLSTNGVEQHIQVRGRFSSNNLHALCESALSNLGIAFLPQALVHEHIQKGALRPILQEYASKVMGIYAVYPRCRQPDQKIKLLIEHLREAFQRQTHVFH